MMKMPRGAKVWITVREGEPPYRAASLSWRLRDARPVDSQFYKYVGPFATAEKALEEVSRLFGTTAAENAADQWYKNPPLRGVASVGSNMTEVEHGEVTILYSYKTPVAVFVPGYGAFVTSEFHSRTTSTHIGKWLRRIGAGNVSKHPQAYIEKIATEGEYPFARNPTLAILGMNPGGRHPGPRTPGQKDYRPMSESFFLLEAIADIKLGRKQNALRTLQQLYEQAVAGVHRNPSRKKIAKRVLAIDYVHASDGKKYTHDFGEDTDHGPVCAYVEDGGRRVVLEASDGRAIVKDY